MFSKCFLLSNLFLLFTTSGFSAPTVVQSRTVRFPTAGDVIVQAREEVGRFPQMVFISKKTKKVLLRSSIEDTERWLIPEKDSPLTQPDLRFRIIRSVGFSSPMVMSVGLYHGGSDDAFFLTVFCEVGGRIRRLNSKPLFANIQGGYYLGYLNKRFGYGLAVWNFNWDEGGHYEYHHYEMEVFRVDSIRLRKILHRNSRRKYDPENGFKSLREIGIFAVDQRRGIPRIKDAL